MPVIKLHWLTNHAIIEALYEWPTFMLSIINRIYTHDLRGRSKTTSFVLAAA